MIAWRNIRLELDRTHGFPTGSVSRAYLIRVPLNELDAIDEAAIAGSPHRAVVRRHWSNEPDESGRLERAGDGWAMRREGQADRLLKLNGSPLRLGEQVLVTEPDGETHPFRIESIR